MRLVRFPFYITIISMFLPFIDALFGGNLKAYIPEILILVLFILLLMRPLRFNKPKALYVLVVVVMVFICFLTESSGFRYGGYGVLSILLTVMVYMQVFFVEMSCVSPNKFIFEISFILIVNVLFIVFENLTAIIFGVTYLSALVGDAYRVDLASPLRFLFGDFNAANSLLMHAQAGSIITIISAIWFFDPFLINKDGIMTNFIMRFFLVLICVVNLTNTSLFLSLFSLSLLLFYFNNSRFYIYRFRFIYIWVLIFISPYLAEILFSKLYSGFDSYYYTYLSPFLYMSNSLNTYNFLFGYPDMQAIQDINGDFGLIMLFMHLGAITYLLISTLLFVGLFRFFSYTHYTCFTGEVIHLWRGLSYSLFLIIVVLFFSLIHYTNIIQPGGRQFFAYVMAIFLVSSRCFVIGDNALHEE